MIRSGCRGSWLLFVAVGAVGCATGVPPDTYYGIGDDGGTSVDAGIGGQDATAQDTGTGPGASRPDAVAGEDAPASADSSDGEGGTGSDSGAVCNRHTCSGCCDASSVCHTQPSPDACPTSFHAGAPCEDCKAQGEDYCVFAIIAYVCSSTP